MPEFLVVTNSFAAPFVSDQDTEYVSHDTPEGALTAVANTYGHPAGLYAAACYSDADHWLKRPSEPLAMWLCNHEQERRRLVPRGGGYSYLGHGPGDFEINGERHTVPNPKGGSVVPA